MQLQLFARALSASARTANPLILDIPASFGVLCVAQYNHKIIFHEHKSSNHFVLTTFQCGFLCSCRPSPVLSAHPVLCARAYSEWSPLTVPRTRARTVVFLQIGNCTSYHRTVRASRCTTSAARIVRCRSLYPIRMSSGANSVVCPVSLRPEMTSHVRRFHITPPVSSHPRCACNSAYSSRVAGDVGSRSVHAAAFDATYQSPPTIVGSDLGAGNYFILCVDGHPFCTAVAVAQCLASSALISPCWGVPWRFKRYICGLLRRAALLSPVSPHAQVPALHVAATALISLAV